MEFERKTCNCCFGMGVLELQNGDTTKCRAPGCEDGFIKVIKKVRHMDTEDNEE